MNYLFDNLCNYGYHDALISSISILDEGVEFVFNEGVYNLSVSGKELTKTQCAKLLLRIRGFNKNALYEYVTACYQKKNKVIKLPLKRTSELNNLNDLMIDNVYFSNFDDSVLIKCSGDGFINGEIILENVLDIEFVFCQ